MYNERNVKEEKNDSNIRSLLPFEKEKEDYASLCKPRNNNLPPTIPQSTIQNITKGKKKKAKGNNSGTS